MNRPYSEATVELLAKALAAGRRDDAFDEPSKLADRWRAAHLADARDALDALAAAGLLLPEGAETRTEYAVMWPEDRPSSFPPLSDRMDREEAERFASSYMGVRGTVVSRRTVADPWAPESAGLAVGDSKPTQDLDEEN